MGQLRGKGLIDEYYISVIPTLLGDGIRLFEDKSTEQKLELVSTQNYNGIVDLVYIKKSEFHGCVMVPILHSVQNVYNKDHGKNL